MLENATFSLGNIALREKADADLNGYFNEVFNGLTGKAVTAN